MTTSVKYFVRDSVAVLQLDYPPVNSLGAAVRSDLMKCLQLAQMDVVVKSVLLVGAGRFFSGGADIREFEGDYDNAKPSLHELMSSVEESSKPVVAAISGFALGGGLELALSAHYRIVKGSSKIGFPEVKLGLIPGAGGTQRFPRLVPLKKAMAVIQSGEIFSVMDFQETRLFDAIFFEQSDAVVDSNSFLDWSIHFCTGIADKILSTRRVKNLSLYLENTRDPSVFLKQIRAQQEKKILSHMRDFSGIFTESGVSVFLNTLHSLAMDPVEESFASSFLGRAPLFVLDALYAACTLNFDEGVSEEYRLFLELLTTPESRALRYLFFAERTASKLPSTFYETYPELAKLIPAKIRSVYLINSKEEMFPERVVMGLEKVSVQVGIKFLIVDIESISLGFLEKITEDALFLFPRDNFCAETLLREDILSLVKLSDSKGMSTPLDLLRKIHIRPASCGIRWEYFSQNTPSRLMEVMFHAPKDAFYLIGFVQYIKKLPIMVRSYGSVEELLFSGYLSEIRWLCIVKKVKKTRIESVMKFFGMLFSPFDMFSSYFERNIFPPAQLEQQTFEEDEIKDSEIAERLVFSLVQSGFRLLEQGIFLRVSDIDCLMVHGYGFPGWRGGPMFYADQYGLSKLLDRLNYFLKTMNESFIGNFSNAEFNPQKWLPTSQLLELIEKKSRITYM